MDRDDWQGHVRRPDEPGLWLDCSCKCSRWCAIQSRAPPERTDTDRACHPAPVLSHQL